MFILKKKGMHCIMRSGIDHCCRMMHHYYDSFQFSAAESLRILFFFYALIILLIHYPFSFNRNNGGFSLKQTGDWKRTHLLLLPFMTHFYDADGDGGSSLSFNTQELHHYSDAFLYQSLPDALFL